MVQPGPADPLRLERRPEAVSFSVEDLLADAAKGRIRVPRFQRGLKWEDADRAKLLDSIYRGFPIGTLLFWKSPAPAQSLPLGHRVLEAGARTDALWVVDGQQRITTLADALGLQDPGNRALPPADPAASERALRFDLEARRFAYGTAAQKPPPRWLPVVQLLDSARLLDWADRHQLRQRELLPAALEVGKRLREYQIPAYIVESEDETVLREIFNRTNASGKPLRLAEVFDALLGARTADHPASLRAIADSLMELGFGRVEEKLVLRALLAVRRKDPGRGIDQIDAEDASSALADTAQALRQAVIFARDEAGFPHYRLLPYKLPLATLSLLFHEHPQPSPRSRALLARWLWRGAINGRHRGDTVALRSTLAAVVAGDEARSIRGLLEPLGERPAAPLDLRAFNFRHARSKLQFAALAALRPRDLQTGDPVQVGQLCEQQESPAACVTRSAHPPEATGLANRLVHRDPGGGELRRLIAACREPEVLASHGICTEAAQALKRRDLPGFLRLRERDLVAYVQEFLDRRGQWNPPDRDRPGLAALVVEDR